MSVLLYGAEIWTLLAADMKNLEAFHMRCQRHILDVRCWAHVSNTENIESMIVLYVCMFLRFGLSTIGVILHHRRLSLFGHVQGLGP